MLNIRTAIGSIISFVIGVVLGTFVLGPALSTYIQTGEPTYMVIGASIAIISAVLLMFTRKREVPRNLMPMSPTMVFPILQMAVERAKKGE
jgi:predicted signal transduction protein with EAL and GGDEF domain